jgi:uncharacterized protein YfaP (DUF2135 family)
VIADAPKPGTYMVYVNGYLIFGEPDGDRNEECARRRPTPWS